MSGQVSYFSGLAAESQVARHYAKAGLSVRATRWRGKGGEIDLVLSDGSALVFVEVKKSRTHDAALRRVSRRQLDRIMVAAEEFAAGEPAGRLTDMRIDIALVDELGQIVILPNATMH